MSDPRKRAVARLLRKRNVTARGCWEWTGVTESDGYGITSFAGTRIRVHRLAYLLWRGEIPPEQYVCHHCDNPRCFNPAHLFAGTAQDNRLDMQQKGREGEYGRAGELNSQARFTPQEIHDMRALWDSGQYTQAQIRQKYPMAKSTMSLILNHKRWRNP